MEGFQWSGFGEVQPHADGLANKDVQLLQECLPGVGEGQHVVETDGGGLPASSYT